MSVASRDSARQTVLDLCIDLHPLLGAAQVFLERNARYESFLASPGSNNSLPNLLRDEAFEAAMELQETVKNAGLAARGKSSFAIPNKGPAPNGRFGFQAGVSDLRDEATGVIALVGGVRRLIAVFEDSPFAMRSWAMGDLQTGLYVAEGEAFQFDAGALAEIGLAVELLRTPLAPDGTVESRKRDAGSSYPVGLPPGVGSISAGDGGRAHPSRKSTMPQQTQPALSPRWPLASDALDVARWEALQLADWCETLYFGFVVNPPVLGWPKDDAPGYLERIIEASAKTWLAEPLLSRLRRLYPSGGLKGWDRRAACGVDALLHFSWRLLMQAAHLRGVQVAGEIGEERFEDVPALERGYLAALIEQDFALLRQAADGQGANQAADKEVGAGRDQCGAEQAGRDQGDADEGPDGEAATAKTLLVGWYEITGALKEPYTGRKKIKGLNKAFQGPISSPLQGRTPMVDREDLLEWWNHLAVKHQELSNQHAGARLSGEAQHNYGRDGTAAPEVNGEVKKRRKDKLA
jgi:hypothetical protein